jgi:stress response protein YsnF
MNESVRPEVTLSEEQLEAGVVSRPHERVRVVREVVSEEVDVRITVRREVLRLERQGLGAPGVLTPEEALEAGDGGALTEDAHELTLHVEVPVISTQVVPYERVNLQREVITEVAELRADLRREQAEVVREDD